MKYKLALWIAPLLILAVVTKGAGSGPVYRFTGDQYVPGEILIGLRPEAEASLPESNRLKSFGLSSLDRLNQRFGVGSAYRVFDLSTKADSLAIEEGLTRVFKLTVPAATDISEMIRAYSTDPHVEFAEPNLIYTMAMKPSDRGYKDQWGLNNTGQQSGTKDADIDAPEAWDLQRGASEVIIAIIDTGVDYTHPDLAGGRVMVAQGRDFVNGDNDAKDDQGHGTFVAGIVAATSNNKIGMAGVCWNCRILPVKVLDSEGKGSAESVAQGIEYAASQGARVLNMSLGYTAGCGCSRTIGRAINYAWGKGSLLVGASGNDSNKEATSYPASSPRVLAVGATDRKDRETDFSNRDGALDIFAPGKDIFSLDLRRRGKPLYRTESGTSAATPFVSGVAALIWSSRPELAAGQVWQTLREATDRNVRLYGAAAADLDKQTPGRLNARSALNGISGGSFAAPEDTCAGEPTDCPLQCAAEVTLEGVPGVWESLSVLRRLRSEVLEPTSLGREWVRLYEQHRFETSRILLMDSEFRGLVRSALSDWMSIFQAVTSPSEEQAWVTAWVTETGVASMRKVIEGFAARGSSDLQRDLEKVRQTLDARFLVPGLSSRDLLRELRKR